MGDTMAKKSVKMAAALAGVNAYLQQEAEAAYLEQQAAAAAAAQAGPNLWAISGRQDMMSMRRMLQLRLF
jgi:hypothetical protein